MVTAVAAPELVDPLEATSVPEEPVAEELVRDTTAVCDETAALRAEVAVDDVAVVPRKITTSTARKSATDSATTHRRIN